MSLPKFPMKKIDFVLQADGVNFITDGSVLFRDNIVKADFETVKNANIRQAEPGLIRAVLGTSDDTWEEVKMTSLYYGDPQGIFGRMTSNRHFFKADFVKHFTNVKPADSIVFYTRYESRPDAATLMICQRDYSGNLTFLGVIAGLTKSSSLLHEIKYLLGALISS